VGFGQNSLDLVAVVAEHPPADSSVPVEELVRLPGGEAATATVACARLGWRTRYVGTFGSDEAGSRVEEALRSEGIDLDGVRRVEAPNRFALILVDRAGHRTVIWHRDPRMSMPPDEVNEEIVAAGRLLVTDAIDPDAAAAAARAARRAGAPTLVDIDRERPNVDALLREVDILIANATFPLSHTGATATGEALRRLQRMYGSAVVISTLGEEGSLALCDGREILTPAFAVDAIDTTGAGDAFRGGFAASWLRLGSAARLDTVLEYASATAALNCLAIGAQTGLPAWNEVDDLVTSARQVRSN
jgi:sugar/nucleoside kinase (ribokinase family)